MSEVWIYMYMLVTLNMFAQCSSINVQHVQSTYYISCRCMLLDQVEMKSSNEVVETVWNWEGIWWKTER